VSFPGDDDLRHLSEQYFTSSQTLAHFFLHSNGRLQTQHIFEGKLDLVYFLILLFLLVLALAGFIIWFGPLSEQLL